MELMKKNCKGRIATNASALSIALLNGNAWYEFIYFAKLMTDNSKRSRGMGITYFPSFPRISENLEWTYERIVEHLLQNSLLRCWVYIRQRQRIQCSFYIYGWRGPHHAKAVDPQKGRNDLSEPDSHGNQSVNIDSGHRLRYRTTTKRE